MRWMVLVVLAVAGCGGTQTGPPFPELAPVSGVVQKNGKPVTGGAIVFASAEPGKSEFLVNSEVGTDGTFTLSTVRTTDSVGERKTGAIAGKYTPTYHPPSGDQTAGSIPMPIELPPVTVPPAGNPMLTLTVPSEK